MDAFILFAVKLFFRAAYLSVLSLNVLFIISLHFYLSVRIMFEFLYVKYSLVFQKTILCSPVSYYFIFLFGLLMRTVCSSKMLPLPVQENEGRSKGS